MTRKNKPHGYPLHVHQAHLCSLRAQLQEETLKLTQQMTTLVHLQDRINALDLRVRHAIAQGVKTLPINPTEQETAAHDETRTRQS